MAKTKKASKTSRKAKATTSRKATASKTKRKTASPKKKATVKKKAAKKTAAKKKATEKKSTASARGKAASRTSETDEVTMDRRDAQCGERRQTADRRGDDRPVPVERRELKRREKVVRRRQIDPTTCERDYTVEEVEFMQALDEYKRKSGRMFPTCSEILEVICGIGYSKQPVTTSQADGPDFAPPAPPAPSAEPFEESLATLV